MARAAGSERLDPARLSDFTLTSTDGHLMALSQVGSVEVRNEEPILKRRDRTPSIEVRGDIDEQMQPPDVAAQVVESLRPLQAHLADGYRIEMAGIVEESGKANIALAKVFPAMLVLMLVTIMLQVRSFPAMAMVALTAPLGLAGAVPILLLFQQPFGFDAILGLIGLAGILMRNTLILIGQIHTNQADGMYYLSGRRGGDGTTHALSSSPRSPPSPHSSLLSVFWGSMAYTLIGGVAGGTVLTLVFLPALYAIWFKVVGEGKIRCGRTHLEQQCLLPEGFDHDARSIDTDRRNQDWQVQTCGTECSKPFAATLVGTDQADRLKKRRLYTHRYRGRAIFLTRCAWAMPARLFRVGDARIATVARSATHCHG
jgi:hypothetical protein